MNVKRQKLNCLGMEMASMANSNTGWLCCFTDTFDSSLWKHALTRTKSRTTPCHRGVGLQVGVCFQSGFASK